MVRNISIGKRNITGKRNTPFVSLSLDGFEWHVDKQGYNFVKMGKNEYYPSKHDTISFPADEDPNVYRKSLGLFERIVIRQRSGEMESFTPPNDLCRKLDEWGSGKKDVVEFANQFGLFGFGYWKLNERKERTLDRGQESINGFIRLQRFVREALNQVDEALDTEQQASLDGTNTAFHLVERMSEVAGFINQRTFPSLSLRVVPDKKGENVTHQVRLLPNTLSDFIEATLMKEVAVALTCRFCLHCGTPFPIGIGRGRSHKVTCSDKCRMARSRKRNGAA